MFAPKVAKRQTKAATISGLSRGCSALFTQRLGHNSIPQDPELGLYDA